MGDPTSTPAKQMSVCVTQRGKRWWRPGVRWKLSARVMKNSLGALEAFGEGDERYSMVFGTNIIASIPAGSIYFGGTDAGRFIITALQKSQAQAKPFFTLSQGPLQNARNLEYLRGIYGEKIYIPTDEDSKRTLQDY